MLQIRKTAGTPQQDADQRPALEPVHRLLRLPVSLWPGRFCRSFFSWYDSPRKQKAAAYGQHITINTLSNKPKFYQSIIVVAQYWCHQVGISP